MPFVALALVNLALGLCLAVIGERQLRASPRVVTALPLFAALALHEVFVVVPGVFYLLVRHADWMLSYVTHATRVPSALRLVMATVVGATSVGGFVLGARWVREHRARWPLACAAALAALALVGLTVARTRVGVVGSTAQFRGGFGMVPFGVSRASTALIVMVIAQGAGLGHLAWRLRRASQVN
jgi:hypothetical protein